MTKRLKILMRSKQNITLDYIYRSLIFPHFNKKPLSLGFLRLLFFVISILSSAQNAFAVNPDPGCSFGFSATKTGITSYSLTGSTLTSCDPTGAGYFEDALGNKTAGSPITTSSGAEVFINDANPAHWTLDYYPVGNYIGNDTLIFYTYNPSISNFQINTATIQVRSSITYSPSNPSSATVGVVYNQSIATPVSGGTVPYTYSLASGSLPTGITLLSNGTLSGTPTAGGVFNFVAKVTDSSASPGPDNTTSGMLSLNVSAPTIAYAPASPAGATVGVAYSQSIAGASGGTSPYTYTRTSGSLPPGITLASNGLLSGTPTAGGSYSFVVTATDSTSGTGPYSQSSSLLTMTVAAPSLTYAPSSPTAGSVATAYSQSLAGAGGGTAPYTYAVTAGSLPAGLSLASNGTLSGTPTAGGIFNFTVTATDSSTGTGPYSSSSSLSLTIAAATVTYAPPSPTSGTAAVPYSQSLSGASGGTAPYGYAITSGSLPAGLSLASNGTLAGTPTSTGNFSFVVTATDSSTGTGPYTRSSSLLALTIGAPTISLAPASLTAATVGVSTSQTITASSGTGPYTYAVTAGVLPAGVTLSSSGVLFGTPTAGGTYNFTVTGTDSTTGTGSPFTGSRAYTLVVNAPTISVSPASLGAVSAGAAFNGSISAGGGISAYSYAVTAGSLPPGISLSSSGVLSGAATTVGSYNFTVTATDSSTGSGPYTGSRAYSWTVNVPNLTISPVSGSNLSGSALTAYSQTFTTNGGNSPYAYGISINSGSIPTGLSFSTSTGVLSGTPTSSGTVNFTVTVTDSTSGAGAPFSASATYNLTIGAPTVVVGPSGGLPNPVISAAYSQIFTASGATTPYSYIVSAGALPAGLTLSTGGALSGVPTATGTFNFTVQATDANSFAGTRAYSVTIAAPSLALTPASLPNGNVGTSYAQSVTASGGTAPYSFAITSGNLPAGLTLDTSNGTISGTPSSVNTHNFTLTVTDSTTGTGAPFTASRAYSLAIAPSVNANLSALVLSNGALSPTFAPTTLGYTAQVANGVTTLIVTPTTADTGATATVNGTTASTPISLAVGANAIAVTVTAPDGVTIKTYTVMVTRAGLQTATGLGTTLSIANPSTACTLTNTQFTPRAGLPGPQQSTLPAGYAYLYPAVDFKAEQCSSGSDLQVTFTFSGVIPSNAVLLKYDATTNPPWQSFTPSSIAGNQVTYTIHDGGPLDGDKAVNGEFVDPVILGVPAVSAQSIPTLDRWALLMLACAMLAMAGWRLRHR